jgi:hypothetical protein
LDRAFQTTLSLHSRANGVRHGLTSCAELGASLLATSKGGDVIISVDLDSADVGRSDDAAD